MVIILLLYCYYTVIILLTINQIKSQQKMVTMFILLLTITNNGSLFSNYYGDLMGINGIFHGIYWELTNKYWLVVDLPLWKMMEFVSWDDDIPNWMESHKIPWFQTTNQIGFYNRWCMIGILIPGDGLPQRPTQTPITWISMCVFSCPEDLNLQIAPNRKSMHYSYTFPLTPQIIYLSDFNWCSAH